MSDVPADDRVLLLAPTSKDARTTAALLAESRIPVETCATFPALMRELRSGVAVLMLPEEVLTASNIDWLADVLREQEPWSDLPVLLLAYAGADSAASSAAVRSLGNVTLLERPLRISTLVSAVQSGLRARQRQYQIRRHLLERAKAEESLRLADHRKDEFLATLGHELRNPLAPLLSGMHLLRLGAQSTVPVKILDVMERQVRHLVRLVDDLLEVSRITRGLVEVRQDPLDVTAVVRAALDTSRPALEMAGHRVTVDLPSVPVVILGDAVRLTQVFANLLTNAAKYTNRGGHITVRASRRGSRVVVSVQDDGIGIAPANLASVFDMFMQVDRTNRRVQGGLGIGLTLVRSLVSLHGGRVEARSAGLGQGSEFIVELPALDGRIEEAAEPVVLTAFPPRRILVVDDNQDAAETLGALLEKLGATVSVVHSGRAALERIETFEPDTVLLDIGMPEMDGYEVARRIRSLPAHRQTLIIALTGWGQDQDQKHSHDAGFDHHLVKPPDLDRLRQIFTGVGSSSAA